MKCVKLNVFLTEEQEKDVNSYLEFLHDEFPDKHYFAADILMDFIQDELRELHIFFSD